jgi:hypothetical protein
LQASLGTPPVGIFWHGFIGDAFSLLAGVAGGIIATYFERGLLRMTAKTRISESADQKDLHLGKVSPVNT